MPLKRKLAAILSADAEGYGRLMDDNEEATIRTLTAYRATMTDLIQQYIGRVVDMPGDNIFAEFISVVDAANYAVEIQRELAERNEELPGERRMQFRIGVSLGDIVEGRPHTPSSPNPNMPSNIAKRSDGRNYRP